MSVSSIDDKTGDPSSAVPSRRFLPKLLGGAIPLAILLFWAADAFAFRGSSPPSSLHLRDFFGPISTKSFSAATAVASQPPIPTTFSKIWIYPFTPLNYTSTIVSRWLANGGQPCRDSPTAAISIPALQSSSSIILLSAGDIHEFTLHSLDASLRPRCVGGDYFETDLSSHSWKSRPPILDLGNGSYTLRLQLHPSFASQNAIFNLSIVLLFRSFDGLKIYPDRLAVRREVSRISIKFFTPLTSVPLPNLQICQPNDFTHAAWSGRWTRLTRNDSCTVDHAGRYRCIDPAFPCEQPWCSGSLAALESNGWVYSAHCAFRLFEQSSAWRCLRGKWLLFWGDSNHVDTIRNLLNFVLGLVDIEAVPRRFDRYFTNPVNNSETLRITNVFNGHWNDSLNYLGLASLRHAPFRSLLWKYLDEPGGQTPDAIVLNSGLHDGFYWKTRAAPNYDPCNLWASAQLHYDQYAQLRLTWFTACAAPDSGPHGVCTLP
ncbi:uncharacterized protein LOC110024796 [Phalaenopsis equestris]|uniref:uncharacterized protein LOC110024796 n=1 Tax=Phalaenopsis equestris TaxID=78828 RepID=UPI0009E43855|nr:uncharacterized protein LOC110024796 [Phalaenopsis equestris]